MAGTTSRVDVAALRQAHPIADVIVRSGVELRPHGGALVGRCPFHDDRGRPNLYVYPDRNTFTCYRCAVGGDVIDFIRRRENVGFREACRRLAGAPSVAAGGAGQGRSERSERHWDRRTLEEQVVLNTACALYQHALWRTPEALASVRARGIPDWLIREGALGYADGHGLEAYLRRHSGLRVAQDLGLLRKPTRTDATGLSEHLAGRIVIPELRGGQCVWLIGRALAEDPKRPKYLALPGERPVLGYERVAGRRDAFLVEGVFDYLTALSWHLPAFSPGGTFLPAERLGFLARSAVVYGVFDGDAAGQAAAERFGALLGHRWRPLSLPEGCDLNDLGRRSDGRTTFFRLLATARHHAYPEDTHE